MSSRRICHIISRSYKSKKFQTKSHNRNVIWRQSSASPSAESRATANATWAQPNLSAASQRTNRSSNHQIYSSSTRRITRAQSHQITSSQPADLHHDPQIDYRSDITTNKFITARRSTPRPANRLQIEGREQAMASHDLIEPYDEHEQGKHT